MNFEYDNGLDKKLSNLPRPVIKDSICCWSDLLGFGAPLSKSNWKPSRKLFKAVYNRIIDAQNIIYRNMVPIRESSLILNDGLVRCLNLDKVNHIDEISMWLRGCIWSHNQINTIETKKDLPGTRTVLTHGKQLIHGHPEINFDDFVYNYSKPNQDEESNISKQLGNPTVSFNPHFMQLNLAFSKAYLLDDGGSSIGLKGNNFFIEENFLEFVSKLSRKFNPSQRIIRKTTNNYELFAIPSRGDGSRYHLGFEFYKPVIEVNTEKLKTKVWKVHSFFPWDEDVNDFKIEINSYTHVVSNRSDDDYSLWMSFVNRIRNLKKIIND